MYTLRQCITHQCRMTPEKCSTFTMHIPSAIYTSSLFVQRLNHPKKTISKVRKMKKKAFSTSTILYKQYHHTTTPFKRMCRNTRQMLSWKLFFFSLLLSNRVRYAMTGLCVELYLPSLGKRKVSGVNDSLFINPMHWFCSKGVNGCEWLAQGWRVPSASGLICFKKSVC